MTAVLTFQRRGDETRIPAPERALRETLAAVTAERDLLADRLAYLEREVFGDELLVPADWRLTQAERRCFGILVMRQLVTRNAVMAALYRGGLDDEADEKIVDVTVCKLRRKLKPHAIAIRTLKGTGWLIEEPLRSQLRRAMRPAPPPWRRPPPLDAARASE